MLDYREALNYPTAGDGGRKRIAIGGLILCFFSFIFPLFLFYGYCARAAGEVFRGKTDQPAAFEDLLDTFFSGLWAGAIVSVWLAMFAVPLGFTVASLGIGGRPVAIGIISAMYLYFVPASVVLYGIRERPRDGFDVKTLFTIWTAEEYAHFAVRATLTFLGVLLAIGLLLVVTRWLAVIPLTFAAPFLIFWMHLVGVRIYGEAVANVLDDDGDE